MANWLVEVECTSREVYVVEADSPEQASEEWEHGELRVSEVVSVEGVTSVRAEED